MKRQIFKVVICLIAVFLIFQSPHLGIENYGLRRVRDSNLDLSELIPVLQAPLSFQGISFTTEELEELKTIIGGEERDIEANLRQAIQQFLSNNFTVEGKSEYDLLVNHLLKFNRIKWKIDDRGEDLGYLERKIESWLEIPKGSKNAYIHITKEFWNQNQDNPVKLAEIVIQEYRKAFLTEYSLTDKNYIQAQKDLLAKIEEAKNIRDLNERKEALYKLLDFPLDYTKSYEPMIDAMGIIKYALLNAIAEVQDELGIGTSVAPSELREWQIWYRAHVEGRGFEAVADVSRKIDDLIAKGKVSLTEVSRAFFTYLPQGINEEGHYRYNNGNRVWLPFQSDLIHWENEDISFNKSSLPYKGGQAVSKLTGIKVNLEAEVREKKLTMDEAIDRLLSEVGKANDFGINLVKVVRKELISRIQRMREKVSENTYLGERIDSLEGVHKVIKLAIYDVSIVNQMVEEIEKKISDKQSKNDNSALLFSIVGAGGAGKGTLAEFIKLTLENKYKIDILSTDDYLYPREFRYAPRAEGGEEMKGSPMYDWRKLLANMETLKNKGTIADPRKGREGEEISALDIIILEGCFSAHGQVLNDIVDLVVGVFDSDLKRFLRKVERDTLPKEKGGPRAYKESAVIVDFAQKQFHEQVDIIMRDVFDHADFAWWFNEDNNSYSLIFTRDRPKKQSKIGSAKDRLYALDFNLIDIEDFELVRTG